MSEISSGTIKEICDTVYKNVLDEIKENLSQMKPQIVQEIVEAVTQREKSVYTALERTIEKIDRRMQELNMDNSGSKESISSSDSSGISDVPFSTLYGIYDEIELDGFKYNGLTYYSNKDMGGCLYKVKADGTCNTRLTDFSANTISARVEDGHLYFRDATYKERRIKID